MSAIADVDTNKPIEVLFVCHQGMDSLDAVGPLEIFMQAKHEDGKPAFKCTIAAAAQGIKTGQGITLKADIDIEDATEELDQWDILVIPGGGTQPSLDANKEPMDIIKAFVELQKKDPSKERTLFSVCTGSLFLAQAGVLQGLAATTHPEYYIKLELLCQDASIKDTGIRTDVMEERYVVNNARFDLGDKPDENPFISMSRPDGRRKSIARKGSESYKLAKRRESLVKRAQMPLGGLRVITSGGVTCGMDAALYLIAALVSVPSAEAVAKVTQFNWQKGVTVEGIDV